MATGTVTFLVTDFLDTTALFERLGDDETYRLLSGRLGILREKISSTGGREFSSTGDGLMVAFPGALAAVQCAVAMQEAVRRSNEGEEVRMELAIGLNTGEPIEDEGNYFGAPVNLAARLCSIASGGHILASATLHSILGSRGGYSWRQLAPVEARGIGSVEAWALLWAGVDERSEPLRRRPDSDSARSITASGPRPIATATILFLDVVDSTPIAERMGDTAFRVHSRDLDSALRAAIVASGGFAVEGKVLGDGIMATFGSASAGIAAALRCGEAAARTQLSLHIGLHAGDVIDEGNNVYGWAVNMASRVCAASQAGEVLVSETVRSLARASTDARFEDRGLHELKGIEEPQRLYAVLPSS
jgi:class 3 adenylate cyclase